MVLGVVLGYVGATGDVAVAPDGQNPSRARVAVDDVVLDRFAKGKTSSPIDAR